MKKKTFQTGRILTIPQISSELTGAKSGLRNNPLSMKIMQKYRVFCQNEYFNEQLFCIINDYLFLINNKIIAVYEKKKQASNSGNIIDWIEYRNEKETIIHIIKRILDDFVILSSIKYDDEFKTTNKIKCTGIGKIFYENDSPILIENIRKELNFVSFKDFFSTINDLHNAFKHDVLKYESDLLDIENGIGIIALYSPYGNLNNIVLLNNDLAQIILGFEDFLYDFTEIKPFKGNHLILEYDV